LPAFALAAGRRLDDNDVWSEHDRAFREGSGMSKRRILNLGTLRGVNRKRRGEI